MEEEPDGLILRVLHLTVNGVCLTYAIFTKPEIDPEEITLGEWQRAPLLSARVMMEELVASRRLPAPPPSCQDEP